MAKRNKKTTNLYPDDYLEDSLLDTEDEDNINDFLDEDIRYILKTKRKYSDYEDF